MATKAEIAEAVRLFQQELDATADAIGEIINDAPKGAGRSTMTEQSIPTAEALAGHIGGYAMSPDKAPYHRILRDDGRTLAYASPRKEGVLLDFATSDVEGAPKRFKAALEDHDGRTTMRVTAKNAKGARALLEWLARQV